MRMIDADALRDNLQALAYDDWNQGVTTSWADAYREVADMVEEMPTIESKKGEWIDQDQGAFYTTECSECHKEPLLDAYGDYVFSDFCPNCGAEINTSRKDNER